MGGSWKHEHEHGESIVKLEHIESETHHMATVISVDGKVVFQHHTDHFNGEGEPHPDEAPTLCSPVCDCVVHKNNDCIIESLRKLGHFDKPKRKSRNGFRVNAAADEL